LPDSSLLTSLSRKPREYNSDLTGFDIQLISTAEFGALTRSLAWMILFTHSSLLSISPLRPTDYFLNKILKIRLFFWGKKLDVAGWIMYYLIMGIVPKFKFMSPLPLSKIYSKNQLKSIGKNSFLCATI
jgi:hypothetical protein